MKHESHYLPVEHEHPDAWHRHSRAEGAPQQEHAAIANPRVLAQVFVVIVVTVVSIVAILVVYFHHFTYQMMATRIESTSVGESVRKYKADSGQALQSYGWVDSSTLRMPIDVATQQVLKKYASGAGERKEN